MNRKPRSHCSTKRTRARGAEVRAVVKRLASNHPENSKAELTVPSLWMSRQRVRSFAVVEKKTGAVLSRQPTLADAQKFISHLHSGGQLHRYEIVESPERLGRSVERERSGEPEDVDGKPRFRPSFAPEIPGANEAEFLSRSQAIVDHDPDGEMHLYLNEPGARLLRAVMMAALPGEQVPRIAGTTLGIRFAERLAKMLDNNARTRTTLLRPAFRLLADQLRKAASDPVAVTVVNADADVPVEDVKKAEREENFHRAVWRIAGGQDLPATESKSFLHSNKAILHASQRLRLLQPHLSSDAEVAEEFGAILLSGESAKIGLTDAEAKDSWYHFAKWLIGLYGEQAKEIFRYENAHHAGTRDRIEQEIAGVPSQSNPSDAASGGGAGPRFRPNRRQPPSDADESYRERSLFDLAENEAVADSAARDRDQLEGQRLTAQLNAPLTREEQLREFRGSSGGSSGGVPGGVPGEFRGQTKWEFRGQTK